MWKLHMQSVIMEKTKVKILKDCYGICEVLNTLSLAFQEQYTCIYKHTHTQRQKCMYTEAQIPIYILIDIQREAEGRVYIHISTNPDSYL